MPTLAERTPVPILQHEKEFETLLRLYQKWRPRSFLEIGTYHGGTLYHWLQNATADNLTLVTVDSYAVGVDNRHLYDDWNFRGVDLRVIEGDSHKTQTVKTVRAWAPFDWVFIDAGHYLNEVTRDWELYGPMVAPGGVCVFHDILTHPAWPSIEVGQLWEQIKQTHRTFEIVADRDAEWGGLGCVLL